MAYAIVFDAVEPPFAEPFSAASNRPMYMDEMLVYETPDPVSTKAREQTNAADIAANTTAIDTLLPGFQATTLAIAIS